MHETMNSVVDWINRAGAMHWSFAAPMFVQSLVLVGVLCGLELVLRSRVRPVVRYWLWMLVVVKLLLPVTLSTPASIAYWVVRPVHSESTIEIAPPTVNAPSVEPPTALGSSDDNASPPGGELIAHDPLPIPLNAIGASPSAGAIAPRPEAQRAAPAGTAPWAAPDAEGWLFIAWLSGAAVLVAIVIRRWQGVSLLTRRASEATPELRTQLEGVCELLRLSDRDIRLKVSDELGCPAICGVWRPTILIPRRLLEQFDEEQLRLVFLHELSHWQRWDMQINLLQTILQVVYFYNPAVWMANAALRRLREEAVDDAVLVAGGKGAPGYGELLLDVAEQLPRAGELSLRMIGILQSRKALVQRIRRIASTPQPRTARLGFWGLGGVVVAGFALLPMAAGPATRAAEPAQSDQSAVIEAAAVSKQDERNESPETKLPETPLVVESSVAPAIAQEPTQVETAVLVGRITDEAGLPVSDAQLCVLSVEGGELHPAQVNKEGQYTIKKVPKAGKYHVMIFSKRCVGLTTNGSAPPFELEPGKRTVRDFTLKLACQVRIQTVDEQGIPIPKVWFFSHSRMEVMALVTDKNGWVTIGGVVPSMTEYEFASHSADFAPVRFTMVLNDPKVVAEKRVVLSRGVAIKGTVISSDGQPAAGWHVRALPTWWNFNSSPVGELIADDGSFTLSNIGPGRYAVSVSIPTGGGASKSPVVLRDIELIQHAGPLQLKVEYPSSASRVRIEGEIKFVGGLPTRGFRIHATSEKLSDSGSQFLPAGESKFRIGALVPGQYRLSFESQEIEPKEVFAVIAPAKDLQVELKVRGQLALRGAVTLENGEPVKEFRVRMIKRQTLRGPNFIGNREWQNISDPQGRFAVEVPGPGVYAVEGMAPGFAITRSGDVNTDTDLGKDILIKLSRGTTLAGTVVDEVGRPVDGAVVLSLAKEGSPLPVSFESIKPGAGVSTVDGKFEIASLSPGADTFHVLHRDYDVAKLEGLEIKSSGEQAPLKIVLKQGCRLAGHVYDNDGLPEPGVTLYFQANHGFGYAGEAIFAKATTDENGRYEVAHLPRQIIYVHREKEWDALGVIRQTVLPASGRTSTVNFGGLTKSTGRLLVNGLPLAGKKLLLSGDTPHFGIVKAQTMTDAEGGFVFRGVPAGEHILYYPDPDRPYEWIQVQSLRFGATDNDLGTIHLTLGTLIVHWPAAQGKQPEDSYIGLQYYDPHWFGLHSVGGKGSRRQADGAPVVFANLPSGKYALTASRKGQLGWRHVVDFKADQREQTVKLDATMGTGTIRGSVAEEALLPRGYRFIEIRSQDESRFVSGQINADGTFEFTALPDGDYFITQKNALNPDRLAEFSLQNGETKTMAISKALKSKPQRGSLLVRVYDSEGLLMEGCDVILTGPNGAVPCQSSQWGKMTFLSAPGPYQLAVGYPGFRSVTQSVELKLTDTSKPYSPHDHEVNVTLMRSVE